MRRTCPFCTPITGQRPAPSTPVLPRTISGARGTGARNRPRTTRTRKATRLLIRPTCAPTSFRFVIGVTASHRPTTDIDPRPIQCITDPRPSQIHDRYRSTTDTDPRPIQTHDRYRVLQTHDRRRSTTVADPRPIQTHDRYRPTTDTEYYRCTTVADSRPSQIARRALDYPRSCVVTARQATTCRRSLRPVLRCRSDIDRSD